MKEIVLHQESLDYIEEVFKDYKEVDSFTPHKGRTIVHMYPTRDTIDIQTGKLEGYIDALLCEVHLYNTTDMTVFKTYNKDEVSCLFTKVSSVRVFKDGSTMILVDDPYASVLSGQSLTIQSQKID